MKIVINRCWGGFSISEEARERLGVKSVYCDFEIDRDDPQLVALVEELGEKANGAYAKLKVVEIPDDVEWEIHDYDGMETIKEVHRSWC